MTDGRAEPPAISTTISISVLSIPPATACAEPDRGRLQRVDHQHA